MPARDTDRVWESDQVLQMLKGSGGGSLQPARAGQPAEGGHDMARPDPVSEDVRTGRFSSRRLWRIAGVTAAVAVAVALATMALIPRNGPVATPDRWSFSIEAEPSTATVALLNGPEAYRPGMLLPPGQYQIEVSAPGFATRRERVTHSDLETRHHVEVVRDHESANTGSESLSTCSGGDFEDCIESGRRYQFGAVPIDLARAAEFYERACDGGHAEGCLSLCILGFMYLDGDWAPQDSAHAAQLFELACNGGDAGACWLLAYMYERGEGVPMDMEVAVQMYERACKGGDAAGCWRIGDLYEEGEGVPMDPARAAELFKQACDGEHFAGCNDLGRLYSRGHGVSQNHVYAAELYHRACEGGSATGCFNLGTLYCEGEGVRQDHARTAQLYRRACDGDNMSGCYGLGLNYYLGRGVSQDRSVAASLFRKACANGYQDACETLEKLDSR